MKKLMVTLLALFLSAGLFAQDPIFLKGDKVLNLGVGLGSTLYSGAYYKTSIPPISASYEMGIMDGIIEKGSVGVGGYLGMNAYKWESSWGGGVYGWKYTSIILGARGSFHYPFVEKLDTYTGLLLGFNILSSKYYGVTGGSGTSSGSSVVYSWYVGGRYYFTDNIAAMAELGYGIAWLNLGIALKL